jgi:catechol 2,3-dioxygenase-like lactoylglutathione lyase family enzyme
VVKPLMDWKLQLILLPVTDVDRAKQFYLDKLGFTLTWTTARARIFGSCN